MSKVRNHVSDFGHSTLCLLPVSSSAPALNFQRAVFDQRFSVNRDGAAGQKSSPSGGE